MSSPTALTPVPPGFLALAAHPVRWHLLRELAHSDLRVSELCARLELPQSLVSYHLRRLRSERLVESRRSAADRRDSFYALDLVRCAELIAGVGTALHPGLRTTARQPLSTARTSTGRRQRVLFLCTGNSARSQIAEALALHLGVGSIDAASAGSHPKPLHANAVRVMRERGIDIAGQRSKHMSEFTGCRFDYVISLCDRVREVCPEFPGHPNVMHWSIPDPAREGDNDERTHPAFRRTVDELATRVVFLLALIEHTKPFRR